VPDRRIDPAVRSRIETLTNRVNSVTRSLTVNAAAQWLFIIAIAFVVAGLMRSNGDRIDDINNERARNVRESCEQVNERHDATKRAVGPIADRERRVATLAIIDALAPKRDCTAYVKSQVREFQHR
jgi:hypothetical protein